MTKKQYIAVTNDKLAQYGFPICAKCWKDNENILSTIGLKFGKTTTGRECIVYKKHDSHGSACYTKRLTKEYDDGRLVTE